MLITFLILPAFAFFDVKSLYEKYEYYYNHSDTMPSTLVGLKPIARLTVAAFHDVSKGDVLLKVPEERIITTFDKYPWAHVFVNESAEIKAAALLISYKMDNTSNIDHTLFVHQFNSDIEPPGYWLEDDMKVWMRKFVEYPHRVREKAPGFERYKELAMTIEGLRSLGYEIKTYSWAQALTFQHGLKITRKDFKTLRGLPLEEEDEKIRGYAFVPLFELFNQYLIPDRFHPEDPYPASFDRGYFTLRAQRDFKKGEETYVPYQKKNNHRLFEDYGISIPFNRHEFCEITVNNVSNLCKITDNGCKFQLNQQETNKNLLQYFDSHKNPLLSYRNTVKSAISDFKFSMRHMRRRVKILEDRLLKQIFHLSISEKWSAYKALALVERDLMKKLLTSLKLS
jgi:hypothetical protein